MVLESQFTKSEENPAYLRWKMQPRSERKPPEKKNMNISLLKGSMKPK